MRVLIATVQVPFVRGGAEVLAESLRDALRSAGHEADIAAVPWRWYPAEQIIDHMVACQLLDVTESMGIRIDRVVALKFPAYLIHHPAKVLWLVHQHRQAYDLWHQSAGDLHRWPAGGGVREAIIRADQEIIPQARGVYTISRNVSERLRRYNAIDSSPLYPPPDRAAEFYSAPAEPYVFFPSRLCPIKRQSLVLEALARTGKPVRVKFAGAADQPRYTGELLELARRLGVEGRVELLGRVSDAEKVHLYARSLAVVYPPLDEDYGYVTLEAMLASKPVVTCTDSGGPLEFVKDRATGLVVAPSAEALARALDEIWENREVAGRWGRAGRAAYSDLGIGWPRVMEKLTA
jgi:glycosyltransferase involved in cell wall biosynthesis